MIADAGQLITRFGEEKGSRPRVRGTDGALPMRRAPAPLL